MLGRLVNLELLANPYNWIVVYLMVAIGAMVFALIDPLKSATPQGDAP
jgi:hypothetical protein